MTMRGKEKWRTMFLDGRIDLLEGYGPIDEFFAAIQADARNAALEEAAEVADDHRVVCGTKCGGWDGAACDGAIAGAIRDLLSEETTS